MTIVVLDGYTENPGDLSWEGFEALGELKVYDRTPAEEIVNRIGSAQIVITNKTPVSRETMEACPGIRYIGVLATGYNVIDTEAAKEKGTTRATACMDKAAALGGNLIIAVGNAPTALVRLHQLMEEGKIAPRLIIGVPVGFVNVVESKELILSSSVPFIVARGRKGGSNVAAAICNALLYLATGRAL